MKGFWVLRGSPNRRDEQKLMVSQIVMIPGTRNVHFTNAIIVSVVKYEV